MSCYCLLAPLNRLNSVNSPKRIKISKDLWEAGQKNPFGFQQPSSSYGLLFSSPCPGVTWIHSQCTKGQSWLCHSSCAQGQEESALRNAPAPVGSLSWAGWAGMAASRLSCPPSSSPCPSWGREGSPVPWATPAFAGSKTCPEATLTQILWFQWSRVVCVGVNHIRAT